MCIRDRYEEEQEKEKQETMCTIGRTPAGTAGKAHHRADTERNPIRGGQERTDCGSKRGRNSFLSTALAPVALKSLVVETYDGLQCGSINVITRENYEFLLSLIHI